MTRALLTLALVALLSGGCAVAPAPAPLPAALWQDKAFDYDPASVTVDVRELFALDAALEAELRAYAHTHRNPPDRLEHLLALIFGPDRRAFAYAGGHSTVAAETWRRQRGDCLSLTIMTVALARALEVPVQMQQVQVPPSFDRRGGVDFLNTHVNVLVRDDRVLRTLNRGLPAADLVIDFEPQLGSRQRGTPLDDRAVLARYLNNIAAEKLSQGDRRQAYAYFKAAVLTEPNYAAAYGNLAQMYLDAGLMPAAEALLRHALALDPRADIALAALHRLLLAQGRAAEAAPYGELLAARREQDPYYWIGLGLDHLQQGRPAQAASTLERAQALTSGFEEVHRLLAIAYWRAGKPLLARDQLAVLGTLDRDGASVAALGRKLKGVANLALPQ